MTIESSQKLSSIPATEIVEASIPSIVQSSEAQMIQITIIFLICVSIALVLRKMAGLDLQAISVRRNY